MKAAYFDQLSETAIDALVERAARATSPLTQVHLHHLGGAIARVDPRATAYGQRHANYVLNVISTWTDPAESDSHIAWARGLHDAMARHSTGAAYINFLGDEGDARVHSAYGAANFARLADAKRAYDPANVFRFNQNIRVAGQPQAAQGAQLF
jgi:FAD/FMN-containing dehydrogenase